MAVMLLAKFNKHLVKIFFAGAISFVVSNNVLAINKF
jgi:hypothetical protein